LPEAQTAESTFHALLIGVDAYTVKPLHGCVNDIDAIQRILVDQAGIPPERITRLTSPHPDIPHETTVPSAPATLANIRAAFDALGSERVAPGDQVFIYYAGHGGRQQVTAEMPTMHRESLLPADFNAGSSGWDVFLRLPVQRRAVTHHRSDALCVRDSRLLPLERRHARCGWEGDDWSLPGSSRRPRT
jgi:uncharacterized caspase-like protein